jgi:phosphate transport system ATP-binding protein
MRSRISSTSPASASRAGSSSACALPGRWPLNLKSILMDEPASALDPDLHVAHRRVDAGSLKDYTIIIVTHNMQQAARVSDYTAMMMIDEQRAGCMIEYDQTNIIFTRPKDKRTEDYVTGRFG